MLKNSKRYFFSIIIFFLLNPIHIYAKQYSFEKNPVGIGIRGGVTKRPTTSLIPGEQKTAMNYGHALGIELFLAFFQKMILRPRFEVFVPPEISGKEVSGADLRTDPDITSYGVHVSFVPYQSKSKRSRIFFGAGIGVATASIKNTRIVGGNPLVERASATAPTWSGHLGWHFFVRENYSVGLEGEYKNIRFRELKYTTDADYFGTSGKNDATLEESDSNKKHTLNMSGISLILSLNFHF